ncbi:hypothetical protein FXO38_16385 [Capsicum annuum]|nr:hypothetical protein FXO37_28184 [Capsicum annuum]KAF3651915.1 hypothetical protein FXO38_16385 [Capsicum annuum]
MDQNFPVDAITTETTDWTSKVQVVDKFRPCKRSDSSVHFQKVLMQDESEQQVSIVLCGDNIPKYENLLGLFQIYLVSCMKVREPRGYSIQADLLTVVVNCSVVQYTTDQSKHFWEMIIIDQRVKHNEQMLLSYTLRSSSSSPSSLNLAPIEEQVLAISIITKLLSMESLAVVTELLRFGKEIESQVIYKYNILTNSCSSGMKANTRRCLLGCRSIGEIAIVADGSFHLRFYVNHWCHFEANIMDDSDTITVMISETLGERMLSLTAEQIYERVAIQQQPLCIACINQLLTHELFKLQLQKPLFKFPDQKTGMVAITSFTEIPFSPDEAGKRQKINPPSPVEKK